MVIEFGFVGVLCVVSLLVSVCVESCRVAFFLQFPFGMPGVHGDLAVARRILEPCDDSLAWLFFRDRSPILPADC